MPQAAKKPKSKPRQRTCLNVEVTEEHLGILRGTAIVRSAEAGYRITPSDLVREWIWSLNKNLSSGVDNANTKP